MRVRPISDAEVENGCTEIAHVIDAENVCINQSNMSFEKHYVHF